MLRRRSAIAAAGVAIAALGITTLPATAGAQEASQAKEATVQLSAGMLQAMERDLGLTPAEAQTRVVNEERAGVLEPALRKDLGGQYGGAWVTGKTAKLVVATTGSLNHSQAAAIERAGATAKVVDHSLNALDSALAKLDRAAAKKTPDATAVWYVDVKSNSVVVESAKPAQAKKFIATSGADAGKVRIVKSAEQPKPFYDLVGGQAYYINNSARCSIGFAVTRGSERGFVSAGHCGRVGASTTGYNRVGQGTFRGSQFPGRDMAYVATNANWTPTSRVQGSRQRVAGSTQAPVGSSVCRSGSTTGWRCGTIQQHNTSVTYPQGTIRGVTRTSACAEPGDSGGSFITGSQAQGVTSGGSGNCRSDGTTFYQPVNPILSAYGLSLVRG
ncbi:S1 family peptidase [Streptomyces gobiensis]|uniref:S1 family peptidase n=1 Tax=Streptomyces gobiensis TaxID=2875706 RepID=UPI001E3955E9|nr:S1 family peptidase [Streptomyces gobiensis]UGY94396.1 S1 family peptidase [Streptomyces gobiensis]